jgi:hypothetical protein
VCLHFPCLVIFSWMPSQQAIQRLRSGFHEPEKSHVDAEMLWHGLFYLNTMDRSIWCAFTLLLSTLENLTFFVNQKVLFQQDCTACASKPVCHRPHSWYVQTHARAHTHTHTTLDAGKWIKTHAQPSIRADTCTHTLSSW